MFSPHKVHYSNSWNVRFILERNKFSSQLVLKLNSQLDSQVLKVNLYSSGCSSTCSSSVHSSIPFYCANSQISYKSCPASLLRFGETPYSRTCMGVAIDEKVAFTLTHAIAAVRRPTFSLSRARMSSDWRLTGRSYLKNHWWKVRMSPCICNTSFDV